MKTHSIRKICFLFFFCLALLVRPGKVDAENRWEAAASRVWGKGPIWLMLKSNAGIRLGSTCQDLIYKRGAPKLRKGKTRWKLL